MDEATVDRLNSIQPGGVILYRWNVSDPEQVKSLISELREKCTSGDPIMVAMDQEGGLVARVRTEDSDFPGLMALGAHRRRRPRQKAGIRHGNPDEKPGGRRGLCPSG